MLALLRCCWDACWVRTQAGVAAVAAVSPHPPACPPARPPLPACLAELPDVRTSTPVESVRSLGAQGPVRVTAAGGASEEFDAVLLATHSDISLKMLGGEGPQVGCARGLDRGLPWGWSSRGQGCLTRYTASPQGGQAGSSQAWGAAVLLCHCDPHPLPACQPVLYCNGTLPPPPPPPPPPGPHRRIWLMCCLPSPTATTTCGCTATQPSCRAAGRPGPPGTSWAGAGSSRGASEWEKL